MKKSVILAALLFSGILAAQEVNPELEAVGNKVKATYYYDNGRVQQEGFFKDGKLDGVWVSYDERGNKKAIGEYTDGVKTGKWIYFNDNNNLSEVAYVDNKVASVKNLQKNALANRN
ncbi:MULTISPECIES: toxin-antitoxin system YwqK family antitoxin [Flavobacterium]|jgi:antitoxin component YwqK of YwqJK toxin-antitoxin module|uniref:Membrane-binding protein n=1 Tax=Flavobacterium panici TaxID=2654843 RepID=A0A9N8J070_9FLAO|nr:MULTISPECIES: membrane-binding protein [Flavobacterium]MDR6760845.1 antitoxin component YwqK of YwqJK toxin-antitoxin module [Flavobacterium sp. 2755]CAC9973793.1 membrane-binding protein [Flavobacterium panici]